MIISWLTHSFEVDIADGIIHAKTAHHVWVDLHDQFSQKNALAILKIQKSMAMMSQGTMTLSAYFTKVKALWDELEAYCMLNTTLCGKHSHSLLRPIEKTIQDTL